MKKHDMKKALRTAAKVKDAPQYDAIADYIDDLEFTLQMIVEHSIDPWARKIADEVMP